MADSDPIVTLANVTVMYGRQQALADVTTAFLPGAVGREADERQGVRARGEP